LEKDCCKITFTVAILFSHRKVVQAILDEDFGKSATGSAKLVSFLVTTGGYETQKGLIQYSLLDFFGTGEIKRTEHEGHEYETIKLGTNDFISRLTFDFVVPNREYRFEFCGHTLEIRPKPPKEIVEMVISKLKQALASNQDVFLKSAETKFQSGLIDFVNKRYRSVPHNIYYALHDLIRCFSIWSCLNPEFKHDAKAQARLTEILTQIQCGKHRQFVNSSIWKEHAEIIKSIDVKRYEELVNDLYKMRTKADYEMDFEIGQILPELSTLMLKVEELFTLAMFMENGSLATSGEERISIYRSARELEMEGDSSYNNIGTYMMKQGVDHYFNIVQKGIILAEGYNLNKFLNELISKDEIHFSPFRPPTSRNKDYVKVEKKAEKWTFSDTSSEEIAKRDGYQEFSIETVKEISKQIKPDELLFIQKSTQSSRNESFCYGECFFEILVYSDGRFYVRSPINHCNINTQIEWSLRLRALIAMIVNALWGHQSTVSFCEISINV
jgi:hypothetical protein